MDRLHRATQGPASTLAGGFSSALGSFTISLQPPSFKSPQGVASSYQSTVDVASVQGFNGLVTLTETDTLTPAGGSIGLPTTTVQVAPGADGLVPLNVNVGASTPSGTYTVTVTGTSPNSGSTLTAQQILTVIVGAGAGKCVNNNDCGTGTQCVGGSCYSCPIIGQLHSGNCVSRDTSICRAETGGAANNACGGCYCSDCTGTQDCLNKYEANYCQSTAQGPCSSFACVNGECVCTKCKNTATPISVSCPPNQTACINAAAPASQTILSQFTVTNTDAASGYNINMSLVPVGTNCACCGVGPSLSTGGGYSIGPGGAQSTTITVPLTCTTTQCYSWNLKITVAVAISNQVIQSFTCPFQICTTTAACFQIQAACNNLSGSCGSHIGVWSQAATNDPSAIGTGCCNPGPCPALCTACIGLVGMDFRAVSFNHFVGTVTLSCSGGTCGSLTPPCTGFPGSVTLTDNGTTSIATAVPVDFSCTGNTNGSSFILSAVGTVTVTGTSSTLTSSATGSMSTSKAQTCP